MLRSCVLLLAGCAMEFAAGAESDVGSIRGYSAADDMQDRNVGAAVVVLCDAKSGLPLIAGTRRPLTRSNFNGPEDRWHVVGSAFEFNDVPRGEYRKQREQRQLDRAKRRAAPPTSSDSATPTELR